MSHHPRHPAVHLAIRLQLRRQARKANTPEEKAAIQQFINDDEACAELCNYLLATAPKTGVFQDLIQFLIDNWEEILKIILALLPLFAEKNQSNPNVPNSNPDYVF